MGKFKGAKGHLLVAAIEFSRLVIQNSFGFVLGTRKRDVKLQKMDISVMFVDLFLKTRGSQIPCASQLQSRESFSGSEQTLNLESKLMDDSGFGVKMDGRLWIWSQN